MCENFVGYLQSMEDYWIVHICCDHFGELMRFYVFILTGIDAKMYQFQLFDDRRSIQEREKKNRRNGKTCITCLCIVNGLHRNNSHFLCVSRKSCIPIHFTSWWMDGGMEREQQTPPPPTKNERKKWQWKWNNWVGNRFRQSAFFCLSEFQHANIHRMRP